MWRENDNEVGLFFVQIASFFYQLSGRLRPMIDLWPFYSPKCKAIMQNAPPFMSHGNRNLHLGCLTWHVQKKWAKIHFFIPMAWTEPKGMKNCFFFLQKIKKILELLEHRLMFTFSAHRRCLVIRHSPQKKFRIFLLLLMTSIVGTRCVSRYFRWYLLFATKC